MEEKRETRGKSEILLSLIGILILLLAVIGISYAVWSRSFQGTKENSLKTGYVTFTYSEASDSYILLEDVIPISDKQGKELSGKGNVFDFSVSSSYKGANKIKYDIFTEPVESNTLDDKYIKVYLTDQNNNPIGDYDNNAVPVYSSLQKYNYNGNSKGRLLHSSYLTANNSNKKYRLRIWVSSDFTDGSSKKSFSFKVNVRGDV